MSFESRYFTRLQEKVGRIEDEADELIFIEPPMLQRRFLRLFFMASFFILSGTPTALSASAFMQLASASSDLFILAPSFNRAPRLLVADARSDPARSIKDMIPVVTHVWPARKNFLQDTFT